ncbi:CLVS2 protein, partial [Acromyrmex heyeri]
MSELSSVPAKLFHSAIIPYNPQDLLGRGRQAGLLESGVGGDGGGRSPMLEEEGVRSTVPNMAAPPPWWPIPWKSSDLTKWFASRLHGGVAFTKDQSIRKREFAILPKPDQNGNWIIVYRLMDPRPSQYIFNDSLKLLFMSYDANLYTNGCSEGYILLVDMAKIRFGHLSKLSINGLRKSLEYVQEGMPLRLKGIYVVNAIWFMDKIIALMRPFMKQELFEMIHIYSGDISDLYSNIPPEYLPKDYGGELDCIANFHKAYCMKLDQLRNYFREEEALFRNYSPNNVKAATKQIIPDATKNLKD